MGAKVEEDILPSDTGNNNTHTLGDLRKGILKTSCALIERGKKQRDAETTKSRRLVVFLPVGLRLYFSTRAVLLPSTSFSATRTRTTTSRGCGGGERKRLRFWSTVKAYPVPSRRDFSPELRAVVWWSKDDFERIRNDAHRVRRWTKTTNSDDDDDDDPRRSAARSSSCDEDDDEVLDDRGLEHVASLEEGRRRHRNKRTAVRTVLTEQRRQRIFNARDDGKLASSASRYTVHALETARAVGIADAEAVRALRRLGRATR